MPDHGHSIPFDELFKAYRAGPGSYDELFDAGRNIRPTWSAFAATASSLGLAELHRREEAALRQMQENGLTYNVHGDVHGSDHQWELDVIPYFIEEKEWSRLGEGLRQRARLLNAVAADLHGPQRLLKEGHLPAELVYDHPLFLRPAHGLNPPAGTYLHFYAADVCRAPDGSWMVLGDHTQCPAGGGYVLEHRIVLSRLLADLFRDSQVLRLASFFQAYRMTHVALAQRHRDNPRIVMLTNGPGDPLYFEHAFLARYLGYTLTEGEDLTVRGDSVFLKMLGGLQPVDVIVRRLADYDCDPLQLSASGRGVAGLVEALRAGQVAMANALGTGLLESPALAVFLPALARALLGEELLLPSAPAWWCGDAASRGHVLGHLDELEILDTRVRAGLPAPKGTGWRELIEASPHHFVARARPALSSVPVMQQGEILARRVYLKAFLTSGPDSSYALMPGGIAHARDNADSSGNGMPAGGFSKDVWVMSENPVSEFSLLSPAGAPVELSRGGGDLPSRVADNLFWLGRYMERAEFIVRVSREILIRLLERPEGVELPSLPQLLAVVGYQAEAAVQGEQAYAVIERGLLHFLSSEQEAEGLRATVDAIRRAAGVARERVSADTWRMLSRLEMTLEELSQRRRALSDEVMDVLDRLIIRLSAFGGIAMESMTRGHGWCLLDMGRRIERAVQVAHLAALTLSEALPHEPAMLEQILNIADSSITYRRRYLTHLQAVPVLDLLLADETNPRSLAFQLSALHEHVLKLPHDEDQVGPTEGERIVLLALTSTRLADLHTLAVAGEDGKRLALAKHLQDMQDAMHQLSDMLTRRYLSHAQASRQLESARMSSHAISRPS